MDRACSSCRFFQPPYDAASRKGECRLMPPSMPDVQDDGTPILIFPPVLGFEWCGQFKPKEKDEQD